MLIEAAERAEAAAKNMLASLHDGTASSGDLRRALSLSKSLAAVVSVFQTDAAAAIAARERHGDGGAQILADVAGLSRRDARSQVKAAKAIESTPSVRGAVEEGRVSLANAKRLAEAVEKTSAADVEADAELLAKAESMRPEDFTKETRRWAAAHQHDGGEADYQRQRARRSVRVWDSDDGMVQLHGTFDPVAGRRIGNRLAAEARRLYDADKQNAKHAKGGHNASGGNRTGNPDGRGCGDPNPRRSFDQCMADALDHLTNNTERSDGTKAFADITVVAHIDDGTAQLVAEVAGGDPLPASVLEELACNARLRGAVYDTKGTLLWQGHTKRFVTEAQMNALKARYGGCFHCLAHPDMCQAHHIEPVSQGGPTNIDNMVLICWDCHQRIHHHQWQIHTRQGRHTLHPPQRTHHGPAHAPEQPVLHTSHPQRTADPPTTHSPGFQPPPRKRPTPRPSGSEQASTTLAGHPDESGPDPGDDHAVPAPPAPRIATDAPSSSRTNATPRPPPRLTPSRRPARRDEPLAPVRLGPDGGPRR